MLTDIQVSDFAIIDSLHIEFETGLNIISGETGAGKSVLLKSLALLMGEKAQSDTVRSGSKQATIEGRFDITDREDILERLFEAGVDAEDSSLVVKRVIGSAGKSKVYINGSLSTVSTLRDLVSPLITLTGNLAPLIEMTGQHDNRHLQSKAYHLDAVDQYADIYPTRTRFTELFERTKELEIEIADRKQKDLERAQRCDYLNYQVSEIEELQLEPGEDERLEQQYKTLNHSGKLLEFIDLAESSLDSDDDSAQTRIQRVIGRAQELAHVDGSLLEKIEPLSQAKAWVEDCLYNLRDYSESLGADPDTRARVEERMASLKRLQKKHGATADEILSRLDEMKLELEELEDSEALIQSLQKKRDQNRLELKALAMDLHEKRLKASKKLAKQINVELEDLNMKGVQVLIATSTTEMNSKGTTDLEFLIKSAKAEEPRSLAKFASGGELSRILLSLKRVVGADSHPRTYLFDEVDAGVSGPTAEKVGRKLQEISKGQQVICVTHLPQVAAFANHHFLIEKSNDSKNVQLQVQPLLGESRVMEIARLISGEKITKTSTAHAKELLREGGVS